jgi:hypothetical protein
VGHRSHRSHRAHVGRRYSEAIVDLFSILGPLIEFTGRVRRVIRTDASWSRAASRLGLECEPGRMREKPRLHGEMRGFEITVDTRERPPRPGKRVPDIRVTRYQLHLGNLAMGLAIERAVHVGPRGPKRARRTSETGDESFDKAYAVSGNDPAQLHAYLDPGSPSHGFPMQPMCEHSRGERAKRAFAAAARPRAAAGTGKGTSTSPRKGIVPTGSNEPSCDACGEASCTRSKRRALPNSRSVSARPARHHESRSTSHGSPDAANVRTLPRRASEASIRRSGAPGRRA